MKEDNTYDKFNCWIITRDNGVVKFEIKEKDIYRAYSLKKELFFNDHGNKLPFICSKYIEKYYCILEKRHHHDGEFEVVNEHKAHCNYW